MAKRRFTEEAGQWRHLELKTVLKPKPDIIEKGVWTKQKVYTYIIRTFNTALLMIENSHKKLGTIK